MKKTNNVMFVMQGRAFTTRWETGWTTCLLGKLLTGCSAITTTGGQNSHQSYLTVSPLFRLGSRFGEGNIDGFNMVSLLLPGVAVTYNGEEIGMVNTEVSWEDTVDPAGLNCGPDHFSEEGCSRDPERTPMQWSREAQAGFTNASKAWLPVNPNYREGVNVREQADSSDSHLGVYRALTELRRQLHHAVTALFSTQQVFSLIRQGDSQAVICVVNLSPESAR